MLLKSQVKKYERLKLNLIEFSLLAHNINFRLFPLDYSSCCYLTWKEYLEEIPTICIHIEEALTHIQIKEALVILNKARNYISWKINSSEKNWFFEFNSIILSLHFVETFF